MKRTCWPVRIGEGTAKTRVRQCLQALLYRLCTPDCLWRAGEESEVHGPGPGARPGSAVLPSAMAVRCRFLARSETPRMSLTKRWWRRTPVV